MAGTTQDGPTIMRYSEQHYPLLTKFRVGPDPLEAEAKNTKIEPTTSTRQTVMGMILRQVTGDHEGQLSRELVRKWEQKRQLEALPKQVDTWFAAEFMRWLRGVSVFNSRALTPWGNANLFHIPEVLAYLREACACRADFQRKLVHLAIFEPRTLNDAYLYYKYIVMHHGWAKAHCGPHLADIGPPPPYFTIGGALDFLDDYALTTFHDQALAMQALNADATDALYMTEDELPRPEPNAAPAQQPAPTMPPPPEDPDAHGGGHDDEDDDDDDDDGMGGDTSLTDLTATEAERAAARLEREAQAAAMAIRPVPHNAPPEARVAAAKQHHRTVLDLGQTSRAALAAAEEEERAAAQAERAAQAAQMSTDTPGPRSYGDVVAMVRARAELDDIKSFTDVVGNMDMKAFVDGMTPDDREKLANAALFELQNPSRPGHYMRNSDLFSAAMIFASGILLDALGKPLRGPAVPPTEENHRPSHPKLYELQKLVLARAYDNANAASDRVREADEAQRALRKREAAAARQAPTVVSPGGTTESPGSSNATEAAVGHQSPDEGFDEEGSDGLDEPPMPMTPQGKVQRAPVSRASPAKRADPTLPVVPLAPSVAMNTNEQATAAILRLQTGAPPAGAAGFIEYRTKELAELEQLRGAAKGKAKEAFTKRIGQIRLLLIAEAALGKKKKYDLRSKAATD